MSFVWAPFVSSLALAGSPELSIALGDRTDGIDAAGWSVVHRPGASVRAGWSVSDVFAVEVGFTGAPDLERPEWRPITQSYISTDDRVERDVSRVAASGLLWLRFSPFHGMMGENIPFRVDLGIGTGVVFTVDDLVTLQAETDPAARKTAKQWLPATAGSFGVRFGRSVGLRLDVVTERHIEVVGSTSLSNDLRQTPSIGIWWVPRVPGLQRHIEFGAPIR